MKPLPDQALSGLRDIRLPADPGWWPPAPGWWLLGAVVLVTAGLLIQLGWRHYRRRRPYREFRTALDALPADHERPTHALREMSVLTRRLAVTLVGREQAAAAIGDDWLALLDRLSDSHEFSNGPGRVLAFGPYQPAADADLDKLKDTLLLLAKPRHLRPLP